MSKQKTPQEVFNILQDGINQGIYKSIRFVKLHSGNKKDEILIPWNKKEDEVYQRLTFIKHSLVNGEPGKYKVEAQPIYGPQGGRIDSWEIVKTNNVNLDNVHLPQPMKDNEDIVRVEAEESISFDDYEKLLKENLELKREIDMMKLKQEFDDKLRAVESKLKDDSNSNWVDKLGSALEKVAPAFLDNWNKQLELKEKQLGQGKPAQISYEDIKKNLEELYALNEDEFNKELDLIEQTNPVLYRQLEQDLGLNDDDNTDSNQQASSNE